jgi:hypothetical protein
MWQQIVIGQNWSYPSAPPPYRQQTQSAFTSIKPLFIHFLIPIALHSAEQKTSFPPKILKYSLASYCAVENIVTFFATLEGNYTIVHNGSVIQHSP